MKLRIQDLSYSYPGAKQAALVVDRLEVESGTSVFLRGPSGSGKSTLLNLIAGVLNVEKNKIFFDDKDWSLPSATARDHFRADKMGIIFQQFNLIPFLSPLENVVLPSLFHKRSDAESRAKELFDHLKLSDKILSRPVNQLSVGQQQRVAMVRALLFKPSLVLADEPTSSLDTDLRDAFIELLLKECSSLGSSLLFVSHDPTLEKHFDRSFALKSQMESEL